MVLEADGGAVADEQAHRPGGAPAQPTALGDDVALVVADDHLWHGPRVAGNALLAPVCDRAERLAHAQAGRTREAALATYERLGCAPRGRAVRARLRAPS